VAITSPGSKIQAHMPFFNIGAVIVSIIGLDQVFSSHQSPSFKDARLSQGQFWTKLCRELSKRTLFDGS